MKNFVLDVAEKIIDGILAGILISLGGAVFLACAKEGLPTYSRYVGALFFCTALLCICIKGYSLYTGRIGYVLSKHTKEDVSALLLGLLGNFAATAAMGSLIAAVFPEMQATALVLCTGKLGQGYLSALARAVLCGLLVYLAVDIFKTNKTVLGVIFCIPVFILSGYEHSIADMFYFAASGIVSAKSFLYLMVIVAGNSVGALVIPLLKTVGLKRSAAAQTAEPEQEEENKAA